MALGTLLRAPLPTVPDPQDHDPLWLDLIIDQVGRVVDSKAISTRFAVL